MAKGNMSVRECATHVFGFEYLEELKNRDHSQLTLDLNLEGYVVIPSSSLKALADFLETAAANGHPHLKALLISRYEIYSRKHDILVGRDTGYTSDTHITLWDYATIMDVERQDKTFVWTSRTGTRTLIARDYDEARRMVISHKIAPDHHLARSEAAARAVLDFDTNDRLVEITGAMVTSHPVHKLDMPVTSAWVNPKTNTIYINPPEKCQGLYEVELRLHGMTTQQAIADSRPNVGPSFYHWVYELPDRIVVTVTRTSSHGETGSIKPTPAKYKIVER